MKQIALLVLLLGSSMLDAQQDEIKVYSSSRNIGGGVNPCFEAVIFDNQPAEAEKGFREWMKSYDAKVSTLKGELFADNALMREMGSRAVDIYAIFNKEGDTATRLIVAFDIAGKCINEKDHPTESATAKKLLYEFALKQWKVGIENKLKAARKQQEKIESQNTAMKKENEALKKDIERHLDKIRKAAADTTMNNAKVEAGKAGIEVQKQKITELEERLRNAK